MITRQQSLHTTCAISACLLLRKCWAIGNRREIFHHKFGFTELEYNNLRNSSCNFESVHVIFRHAQKQYCWWLGIPNLSWKCYGCLKGPDMNKKTMECWYDKSHSILCFYIKHEILYSIKHSNYILSQSRLVSPSWWAMLYLSPVS